jgi:hypothetical protein
LFTEYNGTKLKVDYGNIEENLDAQDSLQSDNDHTDSLDIEVEPLMSDLKKKKRSKVNKKVKKVRKVMKKLHKVLWPLCAVPSVRFKWVDYFRELSLL